MMDQAIYAHSEFVFITTFCMRQYSLIMYADDYTWFPNVVVDVFGKGRGIVK